MSIQYFPFLVRQIVFFRIDHLVEQFRPQVVIYEFDGNEFLLLLHSLDQCIGRLESELVIAFQISQFRDGKSPTIFRIGFTHGVVVSRSANAGLARTGTSGRCSSFRRTPCEVRCSVGLSAVPRCTVQDCMEGVSDGAGDSSLEGATQLPP